MFLLGLVLGCLLATQAAPVPSLEHAHAAKVSRHLTKMAERRYNRLSRVAIAQRRLNRHQSIKPPPNAYVYGDKEATWDHTQALIDWAEGKPHTVETRRAARQQERSVQEAAALLQLPLNDDPIVRSSKMLRSWRLHIQDRIDVQETARRQNNKLDDDQARSQLGLDGSTTGLQNHYKDNKQKVDDVVTMLLSTKDDGTTNGFKKVAQQKLINDLLKKEKKLSTAKPLSFLETMSSIQINGGGDQKCIMCLYFMEKLEQKVGNPSRDMHGNPEGNSNAGGGSTYPGPASYEKGAVESQPQYSPIPGPGYSSGALFLQTEATLGTKSKMKGMNPLPPSKNPNDYQTLISNDQNLHQRLKLNYNNEPKERRHQSETENNQQNLIKDLNSMGVGDVQFLDTGALDASRIGAGIAASATSATSAKSSATSGMKSAMASIQDASVGTSASMQTTNALAAAYDAAHDPYLGLRPEDQTNPPKLSLLELKVQTQTKIHSKIHSKTTTKTTTAKGFVGAVASMASSAAASMGMGINCPEGMPFCRKALRRVGKRSLARRERRAAKNKEMSDTMAMMQDAVDEMRNDVSQYGANELNTFSGQLSKIASEYLHDYSDEEICSDINMCSVGQNAGQLPIAKSAFSGIRL